MKRLEAARALLACAAAALLLAGCSKARWTARGTVEGGAGKALVLEAPNSVGAWYPLDTITIAGDGTFSVRHEPLGHPEVMRLTLPDGQSAYFPVDSLESVTLQGSAATWATATTVAGSPQADLMQQANDLIASTVKAKGEQAVAYDPDLKRALAEMILRDPSGIAAYYIIFRRVGSTPVFDPAERGDLRIIGAVANAYDSRRPGDPRTQLLRRLFLDNRRSEALRADTLVAQEIRLPEIALADPSGATRSLSEVTSHGKVVVLNFTALTAKEAPALNLELARLYEAHRAQGLEIYQVAVDPDEYRWREAARSLPWVAVYNPADDPDGNLARYNVTELPALFVINRNGELVERVENVNRLSGAVGRYL